MRLILARPVSLEVKKEVDNAIMATAQPKQEAPSVVMAKDAIEAGVRGIEELRKVSYVPMLFMLCIFINFSNLKGLSRAFWTILRARLLWCSTSFIT